jgi:hypothetical protein
MVTNSVYFLTHGKLKLRTKLVNLRKHFNFKKKKLTIQQTLTPIVALVLVCIGQPVIANCVQLDYFVHIQFYAHFCQHLLAFGGGHLKIKFLGRQAKFNTKRQANSYLKAPNFRHLIYARIIQGGNPCRGAKTKSCGPNCAIRHSLFIFIIGEKERRGKKLFCWFF